MFEDRLCLHCAAWWQRGDDAFCGRCGAPCAQLQLSVRPSVLQVAHLPPRLVCSLTNGSCAELPVRGVDAPPWLLPALASGVPLAPGQTVSFLAGIAGAPLTSPQAASLAVETAAGGAATEILWIEQTPALLCIPDRLEVWSGCDADTNRASLRLHPAVGALRVRGVEAPRLRGRVETAIGAAGFLASAENPLPLILHLDARGFDGSTVRSSLRVAYDSPHGPAAVEVPIAVAVRPRPQLRWEGEHQRPAPLAQADRQRLAFTFRNQAPDGRSGGSENAPLIVTSVQLTPRLPVPGIAARLLSPLPHTLAGGQAWVAECEVDLEGLKGQPLQGVELELTVITNLPVLRSVVTVLAEPMRPFDGVIAIDFGSSNTCCATLQEGGEPRFLVLDEASVISPTVVSYLDLTPDPPLVETGARIARSVEDEERAASTADRLKQRLGDERQTLSVRPKRTRKWVLRQAGEAATDYLRAIRQAAEREQRATFHDFVLTHPARCSLRQYSRLRRALTDAFAAPDAQVTFLPEPIAALVPFMVEAARAPAPAPYTVASFDLGGGTTDIAVLRVEYASTATGQIEVQPRILRCRGLNFGGEDLSDYLVTELTHRCEDYLRVAEPGATLIDDTVDAAAAIDVRRNRAALLGAAEQFKASLSEQGTVAEPAEISLRIRGANGLTVGRSLDFRPLRSSVGSSLAGQFEDHARLQIGCAAQLLLDAVRSTGAPPDTIQMSGLTTYLPVVRQILTELFPGVTIVRAPDPKECVVRGACLARSLTGSQARGRVLLHLPEGTRLTSGIGVFAPGSPVFLPLLRVDEAVPADGLERTLPNFWNGTEAVVLWEDLNDAHEPIEYSSAAAQLSRLGSWEPERTVPLRAGERWTLCLALKDLRLELSAIGPDGERVHFRSTSDTGTDEPAKSRG